MIVVLVCVVYQFRKGNMRFMTIIKSLSNTVVINVKPSAMYVDMCVLILLLLVPMLSDMGDKRIYLCS